MSERLLEDMSTMVHRALAVMSTRNHMISSWRRSKYCVRQMHQMAGNMCHVTKMDMAKYRRWRLCVAPVRLRCAVATEARASMASLCTMDAPPDSRGDKAWSLDRRTPMRVVVSVCWSDHVGARYRCMIPNMMSSKAHMDTKNHTDCSHTGATTDPSQPEIIMM